MLLEDNKAIIQRLSHRLFEVFDKKNLELLDELVVLYYIDHPYQFQGLKN